MMYDIHRRIDIVEAISHCRSRPRYSVLIVVENTEAIERYANELRPLLKKSEALVKMRAHNIEITFLNGSRCDFIPVEYICGRRVHEAYCFTDIDERYINEVIRPQVTLKYKAEESN